ncbi:MAG: sulfotransferase [Nitrospirales bacterium]|nr:sulfotransferase [Nitrospirales bacterium]
MSPTSPKRFAFIIGAMKCGTSALFEYLSGNPQIAPSREKEPGFFAFDRLYNQGIETYHRQWNFDPSQHRIALEASTHYSKAPNISGVPERIHQHLKNIKFIYLVRNPFDRIESQYNFDLYRGRITRDTPITSDHFIHLSKYRYQLAQFEEFFSRDQILVLPCTMLQHHLRESLTMICKFLEIDDDFSSLSPIEINVTHPLTKTEVLLRRLGLGFALNRLPLGTKAALIRGETIPPRRLTPGEREAVYAALKDDIETLHQEYGIATGSWLP